MWLLIFIIAGNIVGLELFGEAGFTQFLQQFCKDYIGSRDLNIETIMYIAPTVEDAQHHIATFFEAPNTIKSMG